MYLYKRDDRYFSLKCIPEKRIADPPTTPQKTVCAKVECPRIPGQRGKKNILLVYIGKVRGNPRLKSSFVFSVTDQKICRGERMSLSMKSIPEVVRG